MNIRSSLIPDDGPFRVLMISYTLLIILITLFLRQIIGWLFAPTNHGALRRRYKDLLEAPAQSRPKGARSPLTGEVAR